MRFFSLALAIPLALGGALHPLRHNPASLPAIESNDNTREAGSLANGVLTVRLEAVPGVLHPEGSANPGLNVFAFREEGHAPSAPGPLLRVPVGTELRVTIRNALPKAMLVRGLSARPGRDSVDIEPGGIREVRFSASTPGTYYYWGRTEAQRALLGNSHDGQLVGALIVDPPARQKPDRIMVITSWLDASDSTKPQVINQAHMFVNGRSWPHTERLTYQRADSVFWRVINATAAPHPMHLHGFYFTVNSRGDATRDTIFTPERQRLAVTELMRTGTTMALAWFPDRPGNWVFHCHLIEHISADQRFGTPESVRHGMAHGQHNHTIEGMAGLMMGLHVIGPGDTKSSALRVVGRRPRLLTLHITERPFVYGASPGYSFVLQEGRTAPAADSIRFPGTPIILRRGEPVEITVKNRTSQFSSVHWHGVELGSFYDGVPDWSGSGTRTAPPIAPGKSFVVKFTPDRAGTFIYHTHSDEAAQLSSGLYGPLIVLERGQEFDVDRDRVILLAAGGPKHDATPLVNGKVDPGPFRMQAGRIYRLRFIAIAPSDTKMVRLLSDTTVQTWRAFAKDGALLPPAQAVSMPAQLSMGAGETNDFEFTPVRPGTLTLEVMTSRRGIAPVTSRIAIEVR